jgi:hypothetical protein
VSVKRWVIEDKRYGMYMHGYSMTRNLDLAWRYNYRDACEWNPEHFERVPVLVTVERVKPKGGAR